MVEDTSTRSLINVRTNYEGEREVIFERSNQMFAICVALRKDLWDLVEDGLPVKVTWKLTPHNRSQS